MSLDRLKPLDASFEDPDPHAGGVASSSSNSPHVSDVTDDVEELKSMQEILNRGSARKESEKKLPPRKTPSGRVSESIFKTSSPRDNVGTSSYDTSGRTPVTFTREASKLSSKNLFSVSEDENAASEEGMSSSKQLGSGSASASSAKRYALFVTPFGEKKSGPNATCGFKFPSGDCFCILKGCMKPNHMRASDKFHPQPGTAYIIKSDQKAYLNPSIDVDLFPETERTRLMFSSKTWAEWNDEFMIARNASKMSGPSKPDYHEMKKEVESNRAFKTPAKSKPVKLEETSGNYYDKRVPMANFKDGDVINTELVKFIDESLKENADDHINFVNSFAQQDELILRVGKSADTKIEDVRVEIGTNPNNPSLGPDLWSSMTSLANDFINITSTVRMLQHEVVKFRNKVHSFGDVLAKNDLPNMKSAYARNMKKANDNQQILSEVVSRHDDAIASLEKELFGTKADLENVRDSRGSHDPNALGAESARLDARIAEAESALAKLSVTSNASAIKFHNMGFPSRNEADAWVETNDPHGHFGLIVDFHIALEHMEQSISGVDSLSRMQTLYKLKIRNNTEALCVNSFERQIPKFLSTTSTHQVWDNKTSLLSKIKSYAEWSNPSSGFKSMWSKQIEQFSRNHKATVKDSLPVHHPLLPLALTSISDTVSFCYNMIRYIDDTYDNYSAGKFGTKKAWHITTKLTTALIAEISKQREATINSFCPGESNTLLNAQLMFYNTLRSLDVMAEISGLNFEDHPAVNTELVKFLSLNTSVEAVDQLIYTTETHTASIGNLSRDVSAADRSAKTASNQATDNKRLIAALESRIKKLENKK